jgi:hypothetical protein
MSVSPDHPVDSILEVLLVDNHEQLLLILLISQWIINDCIGRLFRSVFITHLIVLIRFLRYS